MARPKHLVVGWNHLQPWLNDPVLSRSFAPMSSKGASGLQDDNHIFEGMTNHFHAGAPVKHLAFLFLSCRSASETSGFPVPVMLEASIGEAEASGEEGYNPIE